MAEKILFSLDMDEVQRVRSSLQYLQQVLEKGQAVQKMPITGHRAGYLRQNGKTNTVKNFNNSVLY